MPSGPIQTLDLNLEDDSESEMKAFDILLEGDDDYLSKDCQSALKEIFARFDSGNKHALSEAELKAFSKVANNGEGEFDEEELKDIKDTFPSDSEGRLTFDGFLDMYHLQTSARPLDTLKDLRAFGYDDNLVLFLDSIQKAVDEKVAGSTYNY